MGSKDRYLYQHIPKTGGVSFRLILENAFHVDEILHVTNPAAMLEHTDETLSRYRFVHGHFTAHQIEHLSGFKKITSLRDPVARCMSIYNFWRGLKDSPEWPEVARLQIRRSQALSLEELIDHPDHMTSKHFHNSQTRMLSGLADPLKPVTAQHLDIALEKLTSFEFVALNEQLDDSIKLLCLKFGFYFPDAPIRLNQSNMRTAVSSEVIDQLKASNALDLQLIGALQSRGLAAINNIALPV